METELSQQLKSLRKEYKDSIERIMLNHKVTIEELAELITKRSEDSVYLQEFNLTGKEVK